MQQAQLPTLPPAPPPHHAPHADALTSTAPVLVAVFVPHCGLPAGEIMCLAGSCPELGGWDPAAARPLTPGAGGSWTGEVWLPPGQHSFKLVVVLQGELGEIWEGGKDRTLRVPHLGALSPSSGPALAATCRWGDTAGTVLRVSPAMDQQRLKAAALAACKRAADLAKKQKMLAARLEGLVHEMEGSEERIASRRGDVEALEVEALSAQLDTLQGGQRVQAPRSTHLHSPPKQGNLQALGPAQPDLAATQEAVHLQAHEQQHGQHAAVTPQSGQPAHVLATSSGYEQQQQVQQVRQVQQQQQQQDKQPAAQGVSAAGAPPPQHAVHLVASPHDGCMHFSFAASAATAGSSVPAAPSAFDLARQQLMHLLPSEAQAQLQRDGTPPGEQQATAQHSDHHGPLRVPS